MLVNNAGAGFDFGVSGTEPDFDAIEQSLETNFLGAYRLTIALLPLLRASEHARVVNVSSGMGGIADMGGWSPGYRVSKAALNAMTRILATELEEAGVKVNSACPGFVATDMGGPMGAQKSVEDGASGIVWLATLPDDGPIRRLLPRRQSRSRSSNAPSRPGAIGRGRPQELPARSRRRSAGLRAAAERARPAGPARPRRG